MSKKDQRLTKLAKALAQLQQLGRAAQTGDQRAAAELNAIQEKAQKNLAVAISDNVKGNNSGDYMVDSTGAVRTGSRVYQDEKIYPVITATPSSSTEFILDYPIGTSQQDILFNPELENDRSLRNAVLMSHGFTPVSIPDQEAIAAQQEYQNAKNLITPTATDYLNVHYGKKSKGNGFFADNGFAEYQSFAARKEFLQNASPEILARLGFDAKSYKGTPEQNKALLAEIKNQEELAESMSQNIRMDKLNTPRVLISAANHIRTPKSFEQTFGTRYERSISPNGSTTVIVGKALPSSKSGSKINYLNYFK